MIRFIHPEDTLELRSLVLRNGEAPESCVMERDTYSSTFHMGYQDSNGKTICILTCQQDSLANNNGTGYRLRGMATHPDWLRQGIGSRLLTAAMEHLYVRLSVDYLWCNARQIAYPFYSQLGFCKISEEFEIPGIGIHSMMLKKLNLFHTNQSY